jgi:hypothetical protein
MEIREQDRGLEKMVFEITSLKLNAILQFCVGDAYPHEGKDRYNVYLVKGGHVHSKVGHYDVTAGESIVDEGKKDFDVKRYKEPEWDIQPDSPLLTREVKTKEKSKSDKPEKTDKSKTPPKPPPKPETKKTNYKVIETTKGGDCFYDSVARAEDEELNEFDEDTIEDLRASIGKYITSHPAQLIEYYKLTVGQVNPTKTLMKDDAFYGKYYKMMQEGEEEDDIAKKIEEELKEHPELADTLDVDVFLDSTGKDVSPNKPNIPPESKVVLKDYFDNKTDLSDEQLVSTFRKNINVMKKWANAHIFAEYEKMKNTKLLLLTEQGNSVEAYAPFPYITELNYDASTSFVLIDYEPENHFRLIEQINPMKRKFTWSELPEVIKTKFPNVAKAYESAVGKSTAPKASEPKASVSEPEEKEEKDEKETEPTDSSKVYEASELDKLGIGKLREIAKSKGIPTGKLGSGSEGVEKLKSCILNPEQEQCKDSRGKKKKGGKFTRRK